jgi:zinc/manganese transport system substrate-binding protein
VAVLLAAVLAALGTLTGCAAPARAGGAVRVVTGTDVWGDVAAQIGGSEVRVTPLINNPAVDPHDYQATLDDAVAVYRAQLIVENGLDYDAFLDRLRTAGHTKGLRVIDVGKLVGASKDANPHLWYLPGYVETAARAIEADLIAIDPAHATSFRANLARFLTGEATVTAVINRIRSRFAGEPVAYTEPVPGYLVQAAGLRLGTPAAFSAALQNGTEPSPADSVAFERALTDRAVRALLYNAQVTDPETDHLRAIAERAGVPVVPVTETLPAGLSFQTWQRGQAEALFAALTGNG